MRFTLKTLLAAVLASAVMCGVFFALPGLLAIAILCASWLVMPPALIAGIVYGRGYGRAFSIGAVMAGGCMPLLWLYVLLSGLAIVAELDSILSMDAKTIITYKIAFAAFFTCVGGSGLVSMAVRWWSLRLQTSNAPAAIAPGSVLHGRVTIMQMTASPAAETSDVQINRG